MNHKQIVLSHLVDFFHLFHVLLFAMAGWNNLKSPGLTADRRHIKLYSHIIFWDPSLSCSQPLRYFLNSIVFVNAEFINQQEAPLCLWNRTHIYIESPSSAAERLGIGPAGSVAIFLCSLDVEI